MTKTTYLAAAIAALLMAESAAADPPNPPQTVIGYLGTTARTYTKAGTPNGEVPVSSLPPRPSAVVDLDDRGHPGIQTSTGIVYLKPADLVIRTDGLPGCEKLEVASKGANARLTASEGVSAGAAEHKMACIPIAPK